MPTFLSILFILVTMSFSSSAFSSKASASKEAPESLAPSSDLNELPVHLLDKTVAAGLLFNHSQSSKKITVLPEVLGAGACAFDINNDGLLDLLLVGGIGHTREYGKEAWWQSARGHGLFLNVTKAADQIEFQNISAQSGIEKSWGMGCVTTDLDQDGFQDLLITNRGVNHLYFNNGDLSFSKSQIAEFQNKDDWSTSASLVDMNNDGLLDIYVNNYVSFKKGQRVFETTRGFKSTQAEFFDTALYDASGNYFYLNLGERKFKEVATDLNLANNAGRSLFSIWHDIDNDNRLDVLVLNDRGSPSIVALNKDNDFKLNNDFLGFESVQGARGSAIADFNDDGLLDFVITTPRSFPPKLLLNEGDTYLDRAWDSKLANESELPFNQWGVMVDDVNLDGRLDVAIANGQDFPDSDTYHVPQGQPNSLFLGMGLGLFQQPLFQGIELDYFGWDHYQSHRSILSVDFDNDGDRDWVSLVNNGPVSLLQNQAFNSENPYQKWLGIVVEKNVSSQAKLIVKSNLRERAFQIGHGTTLFGIEDARILVTFLPEEKLTALYLEQKNNRETIQLPNVDNRYFSLSNGKLTETQNTYWPQNPIDDFWPEGIEINSTVFALSVRWQMETAGEKLNTYRILERLDQINEASDFYQIILNSKKLAALPFVYHALQSEQESVVIAAIRWLGYQEEENTLYWLLELLEHSNEKIVCEVSETLRHFFAEEEAVTHRKRLAIAPLIKRLEQSSRQEKICIIEALSESESYRAIKPISRLFKSNNTDVRKAAISAVGRIRHSSALKDVVQQLKQEQEATVKLSALVALSRIDQELAKKWVEKLLGQASESIYLDEYVQLLEALVSERQESIVIYGKALRAIKGVMPVLNNEVLNSNHDVELVIRLFDALAETRDIDIQSNMLGILSQLKFTLQLELIEALINNYLPENEKDLLAWFQNNKRQAVISLLQRNNFEEPMPTSITEHLIQKNIPSELILPSMQVSASLTVERWLKTELNKKSDKGYSPDLLQLCSRMPVSRLGLSKWQYSQDLKTKELFFICQLRQNIVHSIDPLLEKELTLFWETRDDIPGEQFIRTLLSSKRGWVKKLVINSLLGAGGRESVRAGQSFENKVGALIAIMIDDDFLNQYEWVLLKALSTRQGRDQNQIAKSIVQTIPDGDISIGVRDLLWQIVEQENINVEVKVVAMTLLLNGINLQLESDRFKELLMGIRQAS